MLAKTTRSTELKTGCLAVNAAFLQEIKDDNQFLDELLLATRDALAEVDPRKLNVRASVELLKRLRDRLAMHFSLEEAFGYFDGALEFPPDLSVRADICRHQHESLYLDVCDVVDIAEKLLYHESVRSQERLIHHLSTAFGNFYRRLHQHDAEEDDLISAALMLAKSRTTGGVKC
jgi:hypothetical protein